MTSGGAVSPTRHYLALDALRGVAAFGVLIFHRGWTLPGPGFLEVSHGYLAVDFFFMLSGFVIACAYEEKLRAGMSFPQFLRIRALRLYPLIVLGALVGLAAAIYTATGPVGHFLAVAPFAVLALPAPPALASEPFLLDVPIWSLFVELVVNLLYALTVRFLTTPVLIAVAVASGVALVAMSSGHAFHDIGMYYPTFWGGLPRAIFPFTLGVLIFRMRVAGRLPSPGVPMAVLAAVLFVCFMPPVLHGLDSPYAAVCILAVFPAIIVVASGMELKGAMAWAATWVGILSYPVYVLHHPLYKIYDKVAETLSIPAWLTVPIAAPLVCAIAVIVHVAYDAPLRAAWAGWARRRRAV